MVYVVNCTGKDGSKDLKVCEHSLKEEERGAQRGEREHIDWPLSRGLIEADCGSMPCMLVSICAFAFSVHVCEREPYLKGRGG